MYSKWKGIRCIYAVILNIISNGTIFKTFGSLSPAHMVIVGFSQLFSSFFSAKYYIKGNGLAKQKTIVLLINYREDGIVLVALFWILNISIYVLRDKPLSFNLFYLDQTLHSIAKENYILLYIKNTSTLGNS